MDAWVRRPGLCVLAGVPGRDGVGVSRRDCDLGRVPDIADGIVYLRGIFRIPCRLFLNPINYIRSRCLRKFPNVQKVGEGSNHSNMEVYHIFDCSRCFGDLVDVVTDKSVAMVHSRSLVTFTTTVRHIFKLSLRFTPTKPEINMTPISIGNIGI